MQLLRNRSFNEWRVPPRARSVDVMSRNPYSCCCMVIIIDDSSVKVSICFKNNLILGSLTVVRLVKTFSSIRWVLIFGLLPHRTRHLAIRIFHGNDTFLALAVILCLCLEAATIFAESGHKISRQALLENRNYSIIVKRNATNHLFNILPLINFSLTYVAHYISISLRSVTVRDSCLQWNKRVRVVKPSGRVNVYYSDSTPIAIWYPAMRTCW